jgi:hypothetical protein
MKRTTALLLCTALCIAARAGETVDLRVVDQIKAEGLERSQVMETLSQLTDVLGPRLTGSPAMLRANEWVRDHMTDLGMKNAHLESWGQFGKGWELQRFSIEMTEPYYLRIIAFPEAWTGGTDGVVSGTPVLVDAETIEDLEQHKGKLSGAIVMTPLTRPARTTFEPDADRYTDEELAKLAEAPTSQPARRGPTSRPGAADWRARRELRRRIGEFFKEEGVAAVLEASRGAHGTLFVGSGGSRSDETPATTSLVVAVEHYGMIQRLLEKGIDVKLELSVAARFFDDVEEFNVVGEIPGTDPELGAELVMLGGHLDSWQSATGATDNAAGCAVALEAARILKAIGAQPRRTIRVALWSGEEQGLLGSRGYVTRNFGDRQTMELQPDHEKFSAYFNLDNGTGRIRGIYCQGNEAVAPIFTEWLEPFHDMAATTVTVRNTGGTDHQSFDAVGLPGFQFIQDRIDYDTRTHHTNMDTFERAQEDDLKQAAVIMASFVYNAAMRDEKLPRKPLPEPRERQERPSREARPAADAAAAAARSENGDGG